MSGAVFGDVFLREFEKCGGRFESILLKVNEGAGELNQAFVEMVVGLTSLTEP